MSNGVVLDTFDPGNQTGIARFENDRLVYSDVLRFEALMRMPSMRDGVGNRIHKTVIELPQSYRIEFQKGDQNDLINLAYKAGRIAEKHGGESMLMLPREWKGQRPKKVTKARAKEALSPFELSLIRSEDDNLWDAVAIGLRVLGRT